MNAQSRSRHTAEAGQVLVLFALFGFILAGALALALDVGYLFAERRVAQAAADAAALAGARAMLGGESNAAVVGAAQTYASANGLPSTPGSGMTVVVQGNQWDGQVTVDLTMPVQRFFLGAIYTGPWEVSAHAVAEISALSDANYILIALSPPGIYVNGTMKLTARNGSIISNDKIGSSGGSNVVTSDGFIDAVGTINSNSGWQAPYGIRDKRKPAEDPFAGYARPSKPSGPTKSGNYRCKKSSDVDPEEPLGDDCSFGPGYYKNATIRIWDKAMFAPGMYYFDNSSIEMKSTNAFIEGKDGVNFYFTGTKNKTFFNPGNGGVRLVAPGWSLDDETLVVHGDYRDIVLWIDVCPSQDFDSQGNQEFFLAGVFYAPCTNVYLHGNPSGETLNGMLVASTITMKGASDIIVTHRKYAPTSSFEIYLVE